MQLKSNAPEVKWIIHNALKNEFARSLDTYLVRTGTLTAPMLDAVRRELAAAHVDAAGVSRIVEAFRAAISSGLKRPKMFLGEFAFKLATTGRNKGAIWVTAGSENGTYLGKIADGKFMASQACGSDQAAAVLAACSDPKQAALAFGQRTGRCSCCGRELSDPASVDASIGPVCAKRYGF
ncbi:DUF6011 domain-containing protein [Burkholderia gladioli]|uniref:DUF6011 domain-containing protein n=1 Tax=Burkholderia gladioli TaxID=28095 RepID=UPI00163DFD30|nr:DUF6011 domain-containing protein [Burkholderia gladioli]